MAGVASQSKSLTQNEEFELPPYADNIIIEVSSGTPTLSCSSDGTTYFALSTLNQIASSNLYKLADSEETVLPKIKITSVGGGTIHYRVSKR